MNPRAAGQTDRLSLSDSGIDADCRFPTVHKLLHILATLPVTTASSERSFSPLRRLKTYLRKTTGEERLNGLAMLQIHRDIAVDPEAVLQKLSEKSRRLDFRL